LLFNQKPKEKEAILGQRQPYPNRTLLLESSFLNGICGSGVFEILFRVKARLWAAYQYSSICGRILTFIPLFVLGKKDNSSNN
jgi:hypothetical protein